jgi:hypothetical protein
MPQATAIQNTKKQAPAAPRPASAKPHRELTKTQAEIADLASRLIIEGGNREDVMPFLAALYRHQYRNMSFYGSAHHTPEQWEDATQAMGNRDAGQAFNHLMRLWPEPDSGHSKGENEDGPKPTTVKEIAQADITRRLRDSFEQLLTDQNGLEGKWLLNEVLEYHDSVKSDLLEAFTYCIDADQTYIQVPWSQADKVRAFVKLIDEKEAD